MTESYEYADELLPVYHALRESEEFEMSNDVNGKAHVEAPAIEELGYDKPHDRLAVPNRFVDVREVTNLVRYTQYQVGNLRAIITEDIAERQAAAAMLGQAAQGLAGEVEALNKLTDNG